LQQVPGDDQPFVRKPVYAKVGVQTGEPNPSPMACGGIQRRLDRKAKSSADLASHVGGYVFSRVGVSLQVEILTLHGRGDGAYGRTRYFDGYCCCDNRVLPLVSAVEMVTVFCRSQLAEYDCAIAADDDPCPHGRNTLLQDAFLLCMTCVAGARPHCVVRYVALQQAPLISRR
jgi:hypothetical protein